MSPAQQSSVNGSPSFSIPGFPHSFTQKFFSTYPFLNRVLLVLAIAALYFLAARLGLSLAFLHSSVSPVWPPSGVALAAVLLLGYRVWPGILLGAFFANAVTSAPLSTAPLIAIGNTLEAISAGFLLQLINFRSSLDRARDVLKFVIAALFCTMISATIGNLSLYLGGAARLQNLPELWLTWWLGDTVGVLVITPLVLTWAAGSNLKLTSVRYLEASILLLLLCIAAMATFGGAFPLQPLYYPLARLIVPFFLWAAFRLGIRGVTMATILLSVIAVLGTSQGFGPFVYRSLNDSLLLLQMFLGSNAVMFLFLAAAVEERRHAADTLRQNERRLAGNLAVTRILAEAPALNAAMPRILRTIAETFGWQVANMWTVRSAESVLRCLTFWHAPDVVVDQFKAISLTRTFEKGVGLPGRVWESQEPAWIPDVTRDTNFPRAPIAVKEGLHAAFAFPIVSGDKFFGVMEFFSPEIREPDHALLEMFSGIGIQIGQFIKRREAEESLANSQQALKLAHKIARGGTWQRDLLTNTLEWSDEYYELLGLKPFALGSTFEDWTSHVHPADLPAVRIELDAAIAQARDFGFEFRMRRAHGEWRWFKDTGRCICDPQGKPVSMLGMTFDITERRRVEEEREKLLNLEQAARADAEAANRLKDEFLATLSHELRTPLVAILGWASTVLASPKRDDELTNHALEVIKRNARLQTGIIEDMLDISRIVAGKLQIDVRPVDLPTIVEAAIATVQPAAEAKDIRVRLTMNSAIGQVSGDPQRLQQVVWNLLSNAIKFTPAGGQVEVEIRETGNAAQITVSDTGEGINPEFLPHIFDRFRQADSSTTRKHGGLGLGLAIVQHLIELHHGTVQAASAGEGQGAVFTVTLPVLETPNMLLLQNQPALTAGQQYLDSLTGLRILYVEDDLDSREALGTALQMFGATVKAVPTVREALAILEDWQPHLLLSDIGMPNEDGLDLIRKVRECYGRVPAIAITGYAGKDDHNEALAAGYQRCLVKPIEPDRLAEVIRVVLPQTKMVSEGQN